MITNILTTKLYAPRPPQDVIVRSRLLHHLNDGLRGKLTLVSAPAGFGKTTLVTEWIATTSHQVAWLSLDHRDSDPGRFLTYVIAALQTVAPKIGEGTTKLLQSPQSPPIELLLTNLLNEIATIAHDFVLVLDDYHVLDSHPIDAAVAFFVNNQPPHMHLVITTREDPRLPLSRWRVRGQLTELRAADLRFTADEATNFLTQVMGLSLSAAEVAMLETRTEGWIAGLQLAALSMRSHDDKTAFIESFTGTHHFVLDYLAEEVLQGLPEPVQQFLLLTSILERFCAPLCDAVLADETPASSNLLHGLQQANLFLIPLDNERRWYRYHHLFRDLLRQRLQQSSGVNLIDLHRRASIWYEANGLTTEAFQHAATAGDNLRAARLIESEGVPLYFRGEATPILEWFASLPSSTLEANPELLVTYAVALMITGTQVNSIEDRLKVAEAALQDTPRDSRTRDLIGKIAFVRGMLAGPNYDIETMLTESQRALTYLAPNNSAIRTMAMWSMGLAHQYLGEREAARQVYTEVVSISQETGNAMVTVAALTCLGQLHEADTQLHVAEKSYGQALEVMGNPPWNAGCEAYLGLARLHYEWNDLDRAAEYAQQGATLGGQIENVDTPVACGVVLARVALARNTFEAAARALAETEQFTRQYGFDSQLPLVVAERVRLALKRGDVSTPAHLLEAHDLPLSNARVAIAQNDPAAALEILQTQRKQFEARGWHIERLRVMVLQAIAHHTDKDMERALDVLRDALELAAPGEFLRIFVDEGQPMWQLLNEAAARGIVPGYTQRLLAEFDTKTPEYTPSAQPLVEPLSERELEILRLIDLGLSNREIAERLFLALDTVKGHNRRIFAKLGVRRRTEAVAHARGLGLL